MKARTPQLKPIQFGFTEAEYMSDPNDQKAQFVNSLTGLFMCHVELHAIDKWRAKIIENKMKIRECLERN